MTTIVHVDFENAKHIEDIKNLSIKNDFHTGDVLSTVCGDEEFLFKTLKTEAKNHGFPVRDNNIRKMIREKCKPRFHANQDNHKCLLMYDRDVPIGFLSYCIFDDIEHIEILFIIVDKSLRRRGYGVKMLDFLKSLNVKHHVITVRSDDDMSTKWYEKNGFYNMNVKEQVSKCLKITVDRDYAQKATSIIANKLSDTQKNLKETRLNFIPII